MEIKDNPNQYVTKDGIVKNKPINKAHKVRIDPRLDAEFGRFVSFLRKFTDGFPNEKIEKYFDEYIERMRNIKEYTLNHNSEWKGEDDDR